MMSSEELSKDLVLQNKHILASRDEGILENL